MPVPFLIAGLGVVAGAVGVGGHLSAKSTNEEANSILQEAQKMYEDEMSVLEKKQKQTENDLLKLGNDKKQILDTSMQVFLNTYERIKHINFNETDYLYETNRFLLEPNDVIEIRELTSIYSSAISTGVAGAATGAVISLAASGALPIITGQLAAAGGALAVGEVGAAAGMAGSAVSFGAAMTPLAAVAAPVIFFTGIRASIKADENLEKAKATKAEAEAAVEKMRLSETLCEGISKKAVMVDGVLCELNDMFSESASLMEEVINKRFKKKRFKKNTSVFFSENDLRLIAVTRALAGAIKAVIDAPILSEKGEISLDIDTVYNNTKKSLPDFGKQVEEVKRLDYDQVPESDDTRVAASNVYTSPETSKIKEAPKMVNVNRSVPAYSRCVISFVIAAVTAWFLGKYLTDIITVTGSKYLFFDAWYVNFAAFWVVLCSSISMLLGGKLIVVEWGKPFRVGTGIGLGVLFSGFCGYMENQNHYIIIPVCIVIGGFILWFVLDDIKIYFAKYLSGLSLCMAIISAGFLLFVLLTKLMPFLHGICLVALSVIMVFLLTGVMSVSSDDE